jgi:hypothetical protein
MKISEKNNTRFIYLYYNDLALIYNITKKSAHQNFILTIIND